MKKILLFFFLIAIYVIGHTQSKIVVCGTFKTDSKIKIKIFEPINGYYNMCFYSPGRDTNYIINNTDSFYYQSKTDSAITIKCYITTDKDVFITKSELVLFSNDSIHLNISLMNENEESIIYTGSNAAGHKLFNNIDYDPVFKYQKIFNRLNELEKNKIDFKGLYRQI